MVVQGEEQFVGLSAALFGQAQIEESRIDLGRKFGAIIKQMLQACDICHQSARSSSITKSSPSTSG